MLVFKDAKEAPEVDSRVPVFVLQDYSEFSLADSVFSHYQNKIFVQSCTTPSTAPLKLCMRRSTRNFFPLSA